MNLQIVLVRDAGDLKNERLVLKAENDGDIGNYIVADTTYTSESSVSNRLRHVFWIPDKEVTSGDLVVIYTKYGTPKTKKNKSGNSTHFFYWGLERTVWNKEEDVAALFELSEWDFKRV